jgi:PAS domain S-box-containing protein
VRAESRTRRHNERLSGELSERRKAEEALRESQSLFSAFMNHLPAVVLLKDSQGEILYTNEAFQELFGERMLGTKASELPGLDGEGAARMRNDDVRALAEGTILVEETIRDHGGRGRTFETRKFVIARTDKPPLLGAVSVDISKRRQAEEQRLSFERQMQQAQKMESLGILAGGIAHDFNNLLMGVLGNIDMALTKTPPESAVHTYLRRADTAAERAADLTNQMLAYSGKGRFVVEAIDLTAVVAEMAPLLATITSKRAAVTYRLAGGLPPVEGDATQIRQVVMNLITNASDALGDREGVIAVTTGVAQADSSGTSATGEPSPEGRRVYVEVSDNGCGMDRVTQARIFDPFFTTKQTGRGLGLAAVLGIVRGHGGEIRLTSEPGHGTTFRVLFPAPPAARPNAARATDGAADSATDASGVAAWKGPRTVLLVDDEETVRTATGEMLRECGFAVATASDGAEAVEVLRARVGEIAAVVLDVTMPRMGGEEAFRRMREIDARVPVILSSGFSEQDAVSRVGGKFSGAGFAGFIQKPYRTKELTELLEAAMAAAEGTGPGPTDAARLRPAR